MRNIQGQLKKYPFLKMLFIKAFKENETVGTYYSLKFIPKNVLNLMYKHFCFVQQTWIIFYKL